MISKQMMVIGIWLCLLWFCVAVGVHFLRQPSKDASMQEVQDIELTSVKLTSEEFITKDSVNVVGDAVLEVNVQGISRVYPKTFGGMTPGEKSLLVERWAKVDLERAIAKYTARQLNWMALKSEDMSEMLMDSISAKYVSTIITGITSVHLRFPVPEDASAARLTTKQQIEQSLNRQEKAVVLKMEEAEKEQARLDQERQKRLQRQVNRLTKIESSLVDTVKHNGKEQP